MAAIDFVDLTLEAEEERFSRDTGSVATGSAGAKKAGETFECGLGERNMPARGNVPTGMAHTVSRARVCENKSVPTRGRPVQRLLQSHPPTLTAAGPAATCNCRPQAGVVVARHTHR